MQTIVQLTRHGISEHNLETRFYMGRSPASRLVEQGREQARLLGARLAAQSPPELIVASSLPRTMETAELIAGATGVTEVHGEDALWELCKGDWEGRMPRENLPEDVSREIQADPFRFRYPDGESYRDVVARVGPAIDGWVQRHQGRRILFVLHGDVIRAVLYHLLRFPQEFIRDHAINTCSLSEFHHEAGRYSMALYNDTCHLKAAGQTTDDDTAR
ncbi:MAG: histidine phosphatase family protein [Deltaproteobacteria bacterium]|nr:histidine phosphatase family protein [Deltaproteobacteria bacterium]